MSGTHEKELYDTAIFISILEEEKECTANERLQR